MKIKILRRKNNMTYLRSLIINILIVFFINNVIPGIDVHYFENVPNIGADLLFSLIVGGLNSLIFPVLIGIETKIDLKKIAIISFVISFLSYIIIGVFDIGIKANAFAVVVAGLVVFLVSTFTNYLEFKHSYKKGK
jgi:hypothetical protein